MFKLLREIRKLLKEIRDELRKSNEPNRIVDEMISEAKKTPESNQKKEFKSFEERFNQSLNSESSSQAFLGHNVEPISKVIENPNAFKCKYKTN